MAVTKPDMFANMEKNVAAVVEIAEPETVESIADAVEQQLAPPVEKYVTYIDDLVDAIVVTDGTPILMTDEQGNVVIERWVTIANKRRWLGTNLYRVVSNNAMTGDVILYDEVNQQQAGANYLTAPKKHGWRFKLPGAKLNLFAREKSNFLTKTEAAQAFKPPAEVETTPQMAGEKRKRSGNRDKNVIAAEKKARFDRQKARRERKEARQRGFKV